VKLRKNDFDTTLQPRSKVLETFNLGLEAWQMQKAKVQKGAKKQMLCKEAPANV